jgi:Domain of unknown function (DUF4403)
LAKINTADQVAHNFAAEFTSFMQHTTTLTLGLLLSMSLFPFCKSTKYTDAPKPPEQYNAVLEAPSVSTLTIPVSIYTEDLVRSINAQMTGKALYEDYSFTDNNNDGLMFNAWKSKDISLFFNGNAIKYRVPLKLWMKKELVLGAAAEAEAELALNFKTTFSINPDWSIKTQTDVEFHEWLSKPVLKTGLGNISVETLANLALNRSKKSLSQTLDDFVSQRISLRPGVQSVWSSIQEPIQLDSAYQMWVKTTPTGISMTPITTSNDAIRTKIAIECLNDVTFGEKPAFRANSNLPDLRLTQEAPDDFQVRVATDVPFPEAERLARNMMVGQVFESGGKKVKVEDIKLWGNNDKIVVNSRLIGSFNGNIYFIGRPEYNPQKMQIEMKDLDFHIDTKNFLHRSAAWIFQGSIKKQMAASMTFPLEENINALKTSLQESLTNYVIQPGTVLNGSVEQLTVESTYITPTSIRVNLFSKGKVNVEVKGL